MAGNKTTMSGKIILDYLEKYPQWMPSHTLASLIYKENKNHFDSPEAIRSLIRYYRGKLGSQAKKNIANTKHIEDFKRHSANFVQPPTWVEEKVVFNLPVGIKNMGFISDLQVPFHDPIAIDLIILRNTE
jgi:hypothetical protein